MSDEMERILEGRARKWLFTQANEPSILAEEESFTDALRSACEEVVRRVAAEIDEGDGLVIARLYALFPTAFPENPDE